MKGELTMRETKEKIKRVCYLYSMGFLTIKDAFDSCLKEIDTRDDPEEKRKLITFSLNQLRKAHKELYR